MHVVIDGYTQNSTALTDVGRIQRFLDTHPGDIGMTRIAPAQVHTYRGKNPEDWGVSGFVLIAESHIAVHTFPARGYANVDIFSCKPFDVDLSIDRVKSLLRLERVDSRVLDRGLEYLTVGNPTSGTGGRRQTPESTPKSRRA